MTRGTKIVGTIGPSSQDENTIRQLMQAGLNVARLNFSHGSHADHQAIYERLRRISAELGRSINIMQDLQGPKIRTGEIGGGKVEIKAGDPLTLTTQEMLGNKHVVPIDFPQLLESVRPGNRILLDDGNLELAVTAVYPDRVETQVILGGDLKSHKGVNLPGAQISIPGFTEKDEEDLKFGLQLGVDSVAVSFVRRADDIRMVRQASERFSPGRNLPIIAKLERPEALDNLDEILDIATGVMVARGDLGVEMPPESVPIAQKRIIEAANQRARVVITATQMLDSMINNPRPTRAEASDVANAIFDGTDAVMLSGETASGKYPVQSVEMMNAIIEQAEDHLQSWGRWQGRCGPDEGSDDTYFITQAARELAHDRNVAAIAIFTHSGRTALLMSKTRPTVPVLAFTDQAAAYQRMNIFWGVTPQLVPHVDNLADMIRMVEAAMLQNTPFKEGQQVVIVAGFPIQAIRPTNLALLHKLGEPL